MMKIERTNTWCILTEITHEEEKFIDKKLSFFDPSAKFSWMYKARKWDGRFHLYEKKSRSFPSGLLEYVQNKIEKDKMPFSFEVLDKRINNVEINQNADISWLRDYQMEAIEQIFKHKNGILHMATGSGKGSIAIALAQKVNCKFLFLAHKKDLLHQIAKRYESITGEKAGIIGDGKWNEEKFTVATFQTLNNAFKKNDERFSNLISETNFICVDECHCIASETYWKILMMFENAIYKVGLSGTPLDRTDKKNIYTIAGLGPVRYKLKSYKLIQNEVLAKPKIIFHRVEQEFDDYENISEHEWHEVYKEYVVSSKIRNDKILEIVKTCPKPALVFVMYKDHGELLEKEINQLGLRSIFLWGEKETEERIVGINKLMEGDIDVIVSSAIFNEGVDLPELKSGIMASAGRSVIATLQKIGRGLRRTENKTDFILHDLIDASHPYLLAQSNKRKKIYEEEGFDVEFVQTENVPKIE